MKIQVIDWTGGRDMITRTKTTNLAEDVLERRREERELADKFGTWVATIAALVVLAGSAVLLFG